MKNALLFTVRQNHPLYDLGLGRRAEAALNSFKNVHTLTTIQAPARHNVHDTIAWIWYHSAVVLRFFYSSSPALLPPLPLLNLLRVRLPP